MEYLPTKFNSPVHRVAVFGGSFDPPTLGHQSVIEQVMPQVDEMVLIPSFSHAFGKNLTDLAFRLEMLAIFIEDLVAMYPQFSNQIHILNIEPELSHLHSTGYVYSYDVLEKVEKIYQHASQKQANCKIEISFVIGPDLAIPSIFNQFYRANDIIKKWQLVVVEQMLAIRSSYIRSYIAEQGKKIPDSDFLEKLKPMLGSRLNYYILDKKLYFKLKNAELFSPIKIKINLAIFSIQNNELCILVNQTSANELPYALIDTQEDTQLEDALNRSILDQLGHVPEYHEQVITQGGRKKNIKEWWLNITYFCVTSTIMHDNAISTWVIVRECIDKIFVDDQKKEWILCLERLKNKASYTSIPCYLLPEYFTLSELQKIYEIVLDYKLEKKSFRRRFLESDLLEDTGQTRKANHRPAQLYRLRDKARDRGSVPYYFSRIIEGARS